MVRLICSTLFQVMLSAELRKATKLMAWLKQQRITMQNETPRYVALTLCLMQTIAPFVTQSFFILAQSQEPKLKMVIKGYATMQFIYVLDNMFAANLSKKLFDNVDRINETEMMVMPDHDYNSFYLVFKRYYKAIRVGLGCKNTGAEDLQECDAIVAEAKALETLVDRGTLSEAKFSNR